MLLYTARDPDFARRAVATLRDAGIPCYTDRIGPFFEAEDHLAGAEAEDPISVSANALEDNLPTYPRFTPRLTPQICIFIGAAVEPTLSEQEVSELNRWLWGFAALAATVVVLYLLESSR